MAVTFAFIQIMWNYLVYFYPMESIFNNRMEIFGEIINNLLMYHVLLFTDFVQDVELRYAIGYSFIAFTGVFISTHMYFMLGTTIKDVKHRWMIKRRKQADAKL